MEFCILLVVGREECYGYSLVQRLRELPNLSLSEGTVYPALARLIDDGLVRATRRPSPKGPPRRYLTLTAAGRKRLREMSTHWWSLRASVEALMPAEEDGDRDA